MKMIVFSILLVAGLLVVAWGFNASESFGSEVKEFFTGSPTRESMVLLISGGVIAAIGAAGLIVSATRRT